MNTPTDADRDWPEDAIDIDNGQYGHLCIKCGKAFTAHKHRFPRCKLCNDKLKVPQGGPMTNRVIGITPGWTPSHNDPDNSSLAPEAEPVTIGDYQKLEAENAALKAEITRLRTGIFDAFQFTRELRAEIGDMSTCADALNARLEKALAK